MNPRALSRGLSGALSPGGIVRIADAASLLSIAENLWDSNVGVSGSPVSSWTDSKGGIAVVQGTGANQPAIVASVFGLRPGLLFDGISKILTFAGGVNATTLTGSMLAVFKTSAAIAAGVLYSQSDSAVASTWVEIGIAADGRLYFERNIAGTKYTVKASTVLLASTNYQVMIAWDGTDYFVTLGGVEENPLEVTNAGTKGWFGHVGGTIKSSIGGTATLAGTVRPFAGHVGAVYLWNEDVTA